MMLPTCRHPHSAQTGRQTNKYGEAGRANMNARPASFAECADDSAVRHVDADIPAHIQTVARDKTHLETAAGSARQEAKRFLAARRISDLDVLVQYAAKQDNLGNSQGLSHLSEHTINDTQFSPRALSRGVTSTSVSARFRPPVQCKFDSNLLSVSFKQMLTFLEARYVQAQYRPENS